MKAATKYTFEEIAKQLGHPLDAVYKRDEATLDEFIDQARELGDVDLFSELIDVKESPFWKGHRRAIAESDIGLQLTRGERWVLQSEADNLLDALREVDTSLTAEDLETLGFRQTRSVMRERLKFKALYAVMLEHAVKDNPPVDGILGQALDDVIEKLRPYQRRSSFEL